MPNNKNKKGAISVNRKYIMDELNTNKIIRNIKYRDLLVLLYFSASSYKSNFMLLHLLYLSYKFFLIHYYKMYGKLFVLIFSYCLIYL